MSLPRVPRSPGILATGVMATLLFVLFTGLSSEGGGWGKTVHVIIVILTTETVTTGPAGVGIIHVDRLISDHGGSGHLHQVLVIIVLEPASEVMEGRVTCPRHVSRVLV